ncbi:TPA: McrC family protein, partial [Klebsiella pneumoniae]|nr:restriction endonuclease [Klebsiella pneumoniae]
QADFYQMFAYGQKYLGGNGEMYLIYPAHDDFSQPIPQHFAFSETLKLWVVPYRIMAKCGERMMWPNDVSCTMSPKLDRMAASVSYSGDPGPNSVQC